MTVDTKKLRELAEAATPGPWTFQDGGDEFEIHGRSESPLEALVLFEGFTHKEDAQECIDFSLIAAVDPQTVIALLDEIERLQTRVSIKAATVGELTSQLSAMTAARDEACDLVSDCLDRMTTLTNKDGADVMSEPGFETTEDKLAELRKVGA